MITGNKMSIRPIPTSSSGQTSNVTDADSSLSARLTRIFSDKGIDIPPSQIQSLYTELSSMGMSTSEIDSNNAVRALLFQRYGILLSIELLADIWESDRAIFKGVSLLKENALSLLSDERFTGENRKAVEALVKSINSLFKGEISPESIKFVVDDIIDLWEFGLESKLLMAAEGQSGSVSEILSGRLSEVELAIESLLKPHSIDNMDNRTGALVAALRNTVNELRSVIQKIDFNQPEAAQLLREAVSILGDRLSVILGEYEALSATGTGGEQPNVFISQFIGENVNVLENRLLSQLLLNASEGDFADILDGGWRVNPLRNIILKSGMSFEWQLLAWYRSGRDPERLYALLHDDLKGMLIDFINRLKKDNKKSRINKKLEYLKKESQNIMKNISNRQLSNILNELGDKRGFYLELPLDSDPEHGHSRIWGRGNKECEKKTLDSSNSTLFFEVETSNIGTVGIYVAFFGKTVTVKFEFEDKTISRIAKNMQEEILGDLVSRGYVVKSVDFSVRTSNAGTSDAVSKRNKNLDVVG